MSRLPKAGKLWIKPAELHVWHCVIAFLLNSLPYQHFWDLLLDNVAPFQLLMDSTELMAQNIWWALTTTCTYSPTLFWDLIRSDVCVTNKHCLLGSQGGAGFAPSVPCAGYKRCLCWAGDMWRAPVPSNLNTVLKPLLAVEGSKVKF